MDTCIIQMCPWQVTIFCLLSGQEVALYFYGYDLLLYIDMLTTVSDLKTNYMVIFKFMKIYSW